MTDKTSIPLTKQTREKLKARGKKSDTYDDIINKLIEDDNNE